MIEERMLDKESFGEDSLRTCLKEEVIKCSKDGVKCLEKDILIKKFRSHSTLMEKDWKGAERTVVKTMAFISEHFLFADPAILVESEQGEDLYFRNIEFGRALRIIRWHIIDSSIGRLIFEEKLREAKKRIEGTKKRFIRKIEIAQEYKVIPAKEAKKERKELEK